MIIRESEDRASPNYWGSNNRRHPASGRTGSIWSRAASSPVDGVSSLAKPLISRKTIQPPKVRAAPAMPRPMETFPELLPGNEPGRVGHPHQTGNQKRGPAFDRAAGRADWGNYFDRPDLPPEINRSGDADGDPQPRAPWPVKFHFAVFNSLDAGQPAEHGGKNERDLRQ